MPEARVTIARGSSWGKDKTKSVNTKTEQVADILKGFYFIDKFIFQSLELPTVIFVPTCMLQLLFYSEKFLRVSYQIWHVLKKMDRILVIIATAPIIKVI